MTDCPRGYSSKTLLLSLISTLPLLLPATARAQQAPAHPQQTQQAGSGTEVAELIVTAEKREQRLIDVPASISVKTSKDITDEHLIAISDLAQEVPNVMISGSSLFPSVTIRGIGSSSGGNPGFAPAAAMYVDGVYQGRERAENLPVCGIEQVEVLRGPQGTLYGKNTIAGAINITTEAPTNAFHASADGQFGNFDFSQVCATVSGPVVDDKLLVSLNGIYRHRDGDILNAFNGKRLDYDNAAGLRGRVIWNPSSKLSVDISADFLHEHDTESDITTDYSVFRLLPPPYSTAPMFNPDTRAEALNAPESGARDVWGVSARVNYDMGDVKLTSITAGRGYSTFYAYDSDGSALNEDRQDTLDDAQQFSQEFRLTSSGAGRFQWILGGYYYHESLHDVFQTFFLNQFPTLILGLPWPLPANYQDLTVASANVVENSYAAFASGNYKFTDKLVLDVGLRWTLDDKTMHFSQLTTQAGSPVSIGELLLAQIPPRVDSLSESVPTGNASLSYKFTPDQVGYVTFSRGYKAGGFNAFVITNPFNPSLSLAFKPEFLNNYEVGFKGEWFDNRLSFNGDVFYDDYTNKQEIVEDVSLLSFTVLNAAKARTYGAEIEADVRPLPGLDLTADMGLLSGKYTSFPNGGAGQNFTGNKLAGAPDFEGTFAAQYQHELPVNGWSGLGRIEVFHTESFFEDPNNTAAYETLPYTYVNARLGVQSDNGRWGVFLWGQNLTNQLVFSGGYASIPLTARAVNFPRTFGIELSYRQ